MSPELSPKSSQRFWDKVEKSDGCWLWTATKTPLGYGHFWHEGRMRGAHRFAYEDTVGAIPEGQTIDHVCKNRGCVNPAHMEVVSLRENILRSDNPQARNKRKTSCPRGHQYKAVQQGKRQGERYCPTCLRERARCRELENATT